MAILELNKYNRAAINTRVWAVTETSERKFGTLTAAGMLAHLNQALVLTMNPKDMPDASNFFTRTVIKHVYLYWVAWPKGKIKVPDILTPPPVGTFVELRSRLFETMDVFIQEADVNPKRMARHPFFGMMSFREFETLHGKHFDHHLAQFGA